MKRMPAVSGQFYPGTASGLSRALLALTREGESPEPAIGVVAPHAGYVYSGAVAGDVFSSVRVPGSAVLFCPNHTGVETNDILWEQVALELPLKVVCSEACRGVCPVCGKNLNQEACSCVAGEAKGPFAILKNLKGKKE